MKRLLATTAVLLAAFGAGAEMAARVNWTQRWPWDTKVDIDFTLDGGTKCDVAVTATFVTNGVAGTLDLEKAGLVGDVWELEPGTYHLSWDPAAAGLEATALKNFAIQVTPVENAAVARKWLVMDLGQGTFEYLADEPEGGWNQDEYKKKKMVFRRIPAGTFTAGLSAEEVAYMDAAGGTGNQYYIPQKTMEITKDYYITIFKTTDTQYHAITNPATTRNNFYSAVSTNYMLPHLRGTATDVMMYADWKRIDWPETRFAVQDGSVIDAFRKRYGNRFRIDLPTSAQWEKAARAGTDTFWYNGGTVETSYEDCTNLVRAIGFTSFSTDYPGYRDYLSNMSVGEFLPNDYGLYDVVGIRSEYVLDRFVNQNTAAAETVDPVGPTNGTSRIIRCQAAVTGRGLRYYMPSQLGILPVDDLRVNYQQTFRFVVHLRPPQSFGGKWE